MKTTFIEFIFENYLNIPDYSEFKNGKIFLKFLHKIQNLYLFLLLPISLLAIYFEYKMFYFYE